MPSEEDHADEVRRTDPNAPIIPTDYGKYVIPDGREAPRLMLDFTCKLCGYIISLDAYHGPYTCGSHETMHYKPFLVPLPMVAVQPLPAWWNKGVPNRNPG